MEVGDQSIYAWRRQELIDRGELPGLTSLERQEPRAAKRRTLELETELEAQVFGAGAAAARESQRRLDAAPASDGTSHSYAARDRVGIVRSEQGALRGLTEAATLADELEEAVLVGPQQLMRHAELERSLLVARSCLAAGLERSEGRGAHFCSDHPGTDEDRWRSPLVVRLDGGELRVARERVEDPLAGVPR